MTGPVPAGRSLRRGARHLRLIRHDPAGHRLLAQAAAALARALQNRDIVAAETTGPDGSPAVLVITPPGPQLAVRLDLAVRDGTPWVHRSGQPLCPADDDAADVLAHLVGSGGSCRPVVSIELWEQR